MRYIFFILLIIFFLSCYKSKRDFFQNVNSENHFLDTFSLSNLKGFGISDKATIKKNKDYYEFNQSENSIYMQGYFNRTENKIFFLPENSENDLLFFDKSFWNTSLQRKSKMIRTKSQTTYEISIPEIIYNSEIKDSTINIKMSMSNILNRSETLVFEINKKLDVLKIEHINCKQDTLIMKFFPKQEVYYKHINRSAVCL